MASDPVLRIDEFNVSTFTYKVIEGQPILLDLLVPKALPPGERPVLIRFHGGFLVYGSRDNLQLTPPRILEYALENSTILVSCDYRLIPESNGIEILKDIEGVWSWVQSSLDEAIGSVTNGKSRADLGRVLLAGESGYLAIQLALRHPAAFRAVIASYPMIDMRSDHFCKAYHKKMGQYPQIDYELVSQHLKQLPDGPQPSTRAISNLPIAMVQHGTYTSFFGDQRSLFPIECLEDKPQLALELPFIWLHHGNDDSEVPIEGSRKFVAKLRELNPKAKLRYTELEAAEHGFWSEINLIQSGEWEEGVKVLNTYLQG
ncbi:alpha beta-hydrolase [Fusarium tjaetaba]|uniref:Alpha beta-hydrolase n=1 Tax=Fusarium tjaetaba TaxID=1567544 RepID=A0A8H5R0U1_9HYPO|nr:alpha beta-hydrolase [Fusarium tjaetaba]KAF5624807.1 alpha beta-hydrolase [Fusarium tjaetaba]